jgi:DNA-binding MurR/RpiR family transcriptional regulator
LRFVCVDPAIGRWSTVADDLDAIRRRLDALAAGDRPGQVARVAMWLVAHLPEVAWNTVGDVAAQAQASPATVVRTLQRAGYAGFSEMQDAVRACLPPSELVWKLARGGEGGVTRTDDPSASTLSRIVDQEKTNLDQLEGTVGRDLPLLVDLLANADRIFVTASLTTVPLATHLAVHLDLLLGNVQFVEASTARAFTTFAQLEPGDAVVGLSFPRYAQATLDALTLAAQVARAVVITDRRGPGVAGAALTLKLPTLSEVHFSSSVALVTLTMALARMLHERVPERVEARLERVDRLWAELGLLHRPHRPRRARRPSTAGASGGRP